MRAFTANFSDLSGPVNPRGLFTAPFLALTSALNHSESPENVRQALYDWLSYCRVNPSHVVNLIDSNSSDEALQKLVGLIDNNLKFDKLPKIYIDTLRRALNHIATGYADQGQQELNTRQEHLAGIRKRFRSESADSVVSSLLDQAPSS